MFKPTTFGKFYLYEKLAIGGMAEIFKAKLYGIAGFEKTLVVKQILPEYASDQEFVKMFIDEANIAVSLTHGNIVPVYELGKIGDRYYIAMEYVDGENLETIIDEVVKARIEIPMPKAVEICIEILKGLDYAHRKQGPDGQPLGIVHRDVSPQNIMVSFDGEVKIVDFGIAKAASKLSLTRVGTLKGKFGYMSPEQALGVEVDRRSDVYAVGIVLWELLTGVRLFDAENDVDLLRLVRAGKVTPARERNPKVPEALDRLLQKALARSLDERYQEAAQFQVELQRWLFSRPGDTAEPTLANWMRALFQREPHPVHTPAPAPLPPPAGDPDDRPTTEAVRAPLPAPSRSRRDVSFARSSQILQAIEQAERAARRLSGVAEPTGGGERSVSRDTAESPGVPPEDTRSASISGDFATAIGAGAAVASVAEDSVLDWDETSDKVVDPRLGEGEYVERASSDGPVIRVPTQRPRRDVPAPWQAAASRADEPTKPPIGRDPRRGSPPKAAASAGAGDVTGDTRKPGSGVGAEPPLFEEARSRGRGRRLALAGAGAFVLAVGGAVIAGGVFGGAHTAPVPTPVAEGSDSPTRTRTSPLPAASAAPAGLAAAATDRKASFDTIPSGASVFLGSKSLGRTPLSTTVPSGEEVTVRYAKQGYRDLKATYPSGTEPLKASERLEAVPVSTPPPAMGTISVQSTPWGEVSIDGVKVKNTPLLNHPVKVGTRKVRVYCPSLKKSETRVVVVRANEDLQPLIFNFE